MSTRRRTAPLALRAVAVVWLTLMSAAMERTQAEPLADGAARYRPIVVARINQAIAGAKRMQAALKAADAMAAQNAWIESRRGWEAIEPVAGEFFGDIDEVVDAWPDAERGYHAVEAALFAGKLDRVGAAVDRLVSDLIEFERRVSAPEFAFAPQGLLNGMTKLAYEIGENKSKGGESPYARTSHIDMQENVEGIEAVYEIVFEGLLAERDAQLSGAIRTKIEAVGKLVRVDDLKQLDQTSLHRVGEELAVLMQASAEKLALQKPSLGD